MTRPANIACATCAFWNGTKSATSGQCRYNAPKPSGAGNWPDTKADSWCGDWQNGEAYWQVQEIVIDDGLAEALANTPEMTAPADML